ncbi:hypothetical protein JCM8202_006408 [Rhodotorula sphaerocarpa]
MIAARAWPGTLFRLLSEVFEDVAKGIVDSVKLHNSPPDKLGAAQKMLAYFAQTALYLDPMHCPVFKLEQEQSKQGSPGRVRLDHCAMS